GRRRKHWPPRAAGSLSKDRLDRLRRALQATVTPRCARVTDPSNVSGGGLTAPPELPTEVDGSIRPTSWDKLVRSGSSGRREPRMNLHGVPAADPLVSGGPVAFQKEACHYSCWKPKG